jgi:hypothetical protein
MSVNMEYVIERVRRYNNQPSDDLLYRIGSHASILTPEDCALIDRQQGGSLNPKQRYTVLDWIVGEARLEIQSDLALLIFGRQQLEEWLEISRQAYPDFEFYLVFEAHEGQHSGHQGIDFSLFWMPKPGAPEPDLECDFPWRLSWDWGEMFWNDYPGGFTNDFDFTMSCYPDQWSFATPNSFCVEGDRYCQMTDEEASLMSVAEALEATKVAA